MVCWYIYGVYMVYISIYMVPSFKIFISIIRINQLNFKNGSLWAGNYTWHYSKTFAKPDSLSSADEVMEPYTLNPSPNTNTNTKP